MQRFALRFLVSAVAVTFVASMGAVAQAPQGTPKKDLQPTVIYNPAVQSNPIAKGNNLYCAGFIQTDKFDTSIEIVGGDEEGETRHYEPGDYIYISTGSGKVAVGDEYSIIRPRGKMQSPKWCRTNRQGWHRALGDRGLSCPAGPTRNSANLLPCGRQIRLRK